LKESIKYFSLALEDQDKIKKGQRFLAVCFILATESDKNIFPELLAHYHELDKVTSNYILVVGPYFKLYNSETKELLNRDEIFRILKNKEFGFSVESWQIGEMTPKAAIEYFIESQMTETHEFADEYNISRNRIPCIVFFPTVSNKKKRVSERIVWSIKNQDYSSILQDFRNIIARLENKYGVWTTKSIELAQLEQQQNTDEMTITRSRNEIETLQQDIFSEEKQVEERLRDHVEQSRLARMKDPVAKRKRVYGYLDSLKSKLETAHKEKKKAESELPKIAIRIKQLKEEMSELDPPNALKEISSLNEKRFVIETFKVAGKFVPAVGLGVNIWGKVNELI
jgi:hypothetical protein